MSLHALESLSKSEKEGNEGIKPTCLTSFRQHVVPLRKLTESVLVMSRRGDNGTFGKVAMNFRFPVDQCLVIFWVFDDFCTFFGTDAAEKERGRS